MDSADVERADPIEVRLRRQLQPDQLPAADVAWRRLQPALQVTAGNIRPRWRIVRIGLGAVAAVLLTAGIAVAGSPDLRQRFETMTGMGGAGNQVTSLQPAPSFAVFQPSTLPPGMRLLTQGYQPGATGQGATGHLPTALMSYARRPGTTASPVLDQAAIDQANQLLSAGDEQALVLVYATGSGQIIGLLEQAASDQTPPAGEAVAIHQTTGRIALNGRTTILTWIDHGTLLAIQTGLDRQQLLQFANRLHVTPLASFAKSGAAASLRVRPTPIPLAQRIAALETPVAAPTAVAQRCGPWNPKGYRATSAAVFQQVRCAAQLVVGDAAVGGSENGLSLDHWRHAATQLGVSPAIGPPGDPMVWVVELDTGAHSAGWVVVLDAQTGQPDAQIELRPVP